MAYSDIVLADNPSYYFRFEGGNVTNSGSATSTITSGANNSFVTGIVGSAIATADDAPISAYGFTHSDNTVIFNDKTFTIEGLFKIASINDVETYSDFASKTGSNIFFGGRQSTSTTSYRNTQVALGFYKQTSPDKLFVYARVATNTRLSYELTGFTYNTWHHIALVANGTTNKIYIDGVEVASGDVGTGTLDVDARPKYWVGEAAGLGGANGFIGTVDELAAYTGALSSTDILDRYNYIAGADISATALTASSAFVMPASSTQAILSATPLTASAASGAHFNSTRDNFTLLDTYMSGLTLEQYYKFDENKTITNYGSGDDIAFIYTGNSLNSITKGVQNHGALRITGDSNDSVYALGANSANPFLDEDFSMGFWVKKTTTEAALIFSAHGDTDNFTIQFNSSGQITTNIFGNNQNHTITSSTDYTDGNWHYVAVRLASTTLQLWVDNVSIGTVTYNHNLDEFYVIDFGAGATTPTELMYVSHFYIATSANVNGTQIANMWTYGQPTLQGGAAMPMPKFSRNNSLNYYIEDRSPVFYFKMDQATGLPLNYGSADISLSQLNSSFTQNITSPNYKAYNFTDRDTQFTGAWSVPTGTFTADDQQTIVVYAKFNSGNASGLFSAASFGGTTGAGLLIQQLANGTVRLRIQDDSYNNFITTSTSYADGNYHMIVGVKDGTSLKLYIDGTEVVTGTISAVLTDAGQLAIGGLPGLIPATGARDVTLDELAVFDFAFTAGEAFDIYQAISWSMDWTASAALPHPTYSAGFGPTITHNVYTATASLPNVFPFVSPATAQGLFQVPNFAATKNVNYSADVSTASATAENPGWNVGENNVVLHMNASAEMGDARALIPGFWNASPAIANPAVLVEPAVSSTLGALIKPQSLNARAFMPIPPAYFLLTDDIWYQRLYAIDLASKDSGIEGFLHFFTESTNLTKTSTLVEQGFDEFTGLPYSGSGGFTATATLNPINTPTPAGTVGYTDDQNRKAVRINNLQFAGGLTDPATGFTLEAMIKTTKDNQVLFLGTNQASRSTAIRLIDGKLAISLATASTGTAVLRGAAIEAGQVLMQGFKNVADGEWHHIAIQYQTTLNRAQIWVDGKLDIQKYGYVIYRPAYIGFNSDRTNLYTDVYISAISINEQSMISERDLSLDYYAAINYVPIQPAPFEASALATDNNKGRGNRGRALMLYFWHTFSPENGYYVPRFENPFQNYVYSITDNDQGYGDSTDQDTFYSLTTWNTDSVQNFYDWDIFPVPVVGNSDGPNSPILKEGIWKTGTPQGTVYVNPITDNYRYLNMMEDIKDLSQFDAIFFRNYPDQSQEKDAYSLDSDVVVDEYFNVINNTLFKDFLDSLRDAVDTGISLFITNPQLAIDMGFIDSYEIVDDLAAVGGPPLSDTYAPIKLDGTGAENLLTANDSDLNAYFYDRDKNNYHRVVNKLTDLTDIPAFIWTDSAQYIGDGAREFGVLNRPFDHYEWKENGLQVGDRFLIADIRDGRSYYPAVPFNKIKAGKVITAFDTTYRRGTTLVSNPYQNYATSIAVEENTVVNGKQIGGKVFISFTELASNAWSGAAARVSNAPREMASVELKTNYWIDLAYANGIITTSERDEYKSFAIDKDGPLPPTTPDVYWTVNGMNLLAALSPYDQAITNGEEDLKSSKVVSRTYARKGNRGLPVVTTTADFPRYSLISSWTYPMMNIALDTINSFGLIWLSQRLNYETAPQRPEAIYTYAEMVNPVVSGYATVNVGAQSMLSNAKINDTTFSSGSISNSSLPMTATARLVELGRNVAGGPMTASVSLQTEIRTSIISLDDQVVLYVMHEDPILYVREEVI